MAWQVRETDLTGVQNGQVIVQSSPNRYALHIGNLSAAVTEITTNPPTGSPVGGLPIPPDDSVAFFWTRDGGLARETWYVAAISGPTDMHIVESLYYPTEVENGQNSASDAG